MALELHDLELDALAGEVSRFTGEPLLFEGDDVGHADVASALSL